MKRFKQPDGLVIKVDFIFARLCRDISKWYDEHYHGMGKNAKKNNHLMVLEYKYNADRFAGTGAELDAQITEFLIYLQKEVERQVDR